ncbi:MAG: ATP-binding protein [Chloroflexota bacterium]|nr:ATP-binding protein [Chloroflexota bacterium]
MTTPNGIANEPTPATDLLQAALDALPAHIAILGAAGGIVAVNAAWREFGADNELALADDGIGSNYLAACQRAVASGDEHASSIVQGMQAVLSGERASFAFDYPCHAPHERRWFAFRIARLSAAGDPRFLVSHENVTPQRLAEEQARTNEARYQAVFSGVGDAILVADEQGHYLDANPAAEDLLGYSREELLTRSVPDLVAQDVAWSASEYAHFLEQGTWRDELELVRKDGQVIPVEALVTAADLPDGKIYLSAIRDVTRHIKAESQLREEREALAIINEVGQLLSAELNLDVLIQEVTNAATALTGATMGAFFHNALDERGEYYTLYTLAGPTPVDFARVPMPRNTMLFDETFRGAGVVRSADVRQDPRYARNPPVFGMPSSHPPVVSYLAVPVFGRHHDVMGGLFFGSPEPGVFTERAEKIATGLAVQAAIAIENARLFQQVEQELAAREHAEADKVQLVDAMAHDLGGPLTVIRGQSQLLRRRLMRGDMSPERLESALSAMDQAVERARLLISDLTDVARLEADRPLDFNFATVDLADLTATAVSSLEGVSGAASLSLDNRVGPVIGWWDANRVMRVLENLLANAIKYSPAGGVVTVRVSREGQGANAVGIVTISDAGMGIPADDLPHIFERFHRGRNVQGRIAGTGLGLWGSHRIVERHGGTIEIASIEGNGTTVTVRLPLQPTAE